MEEFGARQENTIMSRKNRDFALDISDPTIFLCSTSVASHSCALFLYAAIKVQYWFAVQVSDITLLNIVEKLVSKFIIH